MRQEKASGIFNRGDLWSLLYAGLFLFSIGIWGKVSASFQLHDTYYVIRYFEFATPIVIFLTGVAIVYFSQYRKSSLKPLFTWIHLCITFFSISYVGFLMFGDQLALNGLTSRYYLSSPMVIGQEKIFILLMNFLTFLMAQIILAINIIKHAK